MTNLPFYYLENQNVDRITMIIKISPITMQFTQDSNKKSQEWTQLRNPSLVFVGSLGSRVLRNSLSSELLRRRLEQVD